MMHPNEGTATFTLFFTESGRFPLSLGIGLGLGWVVLSWVIRHPVATIHAVLRTALVPGLWWALPAHPSRAVSLAW